MKSSVSRLDAFVVALVLAGVVGLLVLFFRDLNAVVPGPDGPPVGQISLKHNTATRKLADALGWQRLYDGAPVYPGDTVRTSGNSDASVLLDDGAALTVLENSMIRLDPPGRDQEIVVNSGTFRVTGGGKTGRVIVAGSSRIELAPNADVSVSASADRLKLQVRSGTAQVMSGGRTVALGANSEATVDGVRGTTESHRRPLMPRFPGPGDQVVAPDGVSPVSFTVAALGPLPLGARLEVARDRSFGGRVDGVALVADGSQALGQLALEAGVWFWRTRSNSDEPSDPVRFTLILSHPPVPTVPEDGAILTGFPDSPSVSMSWAGSPGARGYRVELSSPGQPARVVAVRGTSVTEPGLPPGVWTWRVAAEFGASTTNTPAPSNPRTFEVKRAESREAPRPMVPLEGTLYETSTVAQKGLVFSWEPVAGARGYQLRIGTTPNLASVSPWGQTDAPWVSLRGSSPLAQSGAHFWAVAWQDAQGRWSPLSQPRRIEGVEEAGRLHPTYPPEGFLAAQEAVSDLRFAWKGRSVGAATLRFEPQDSGNPVEVTAQGEAIVGIALAEGRWRWSVRTPNADQKTFQLTEPRALTVVKALAPPRLEAPAPGQSLVVPQGQPITLSWAALAPADSYDVVVQGPQDEVRLTGVEATSVVLPLAVAGAYRWQVEGTKEAGPGSTRVPGTWASSTFTVERYTRMALVSPVRGVPFDGLTAWKPGVKLVWTAPDTPTSATLQVSRNGAPFPVPGLPSPRSTRITLAKLPEGNYTWTLRASRPGQDLSPERGGSFTVTALPPLGAPRLTPTPGTVLGPDWFQANRSIRLAWTAVDGAQSYAVRLWSLASKRTVYSASGLTETSVILSDLSKLDRGTYAWEVTASRPSDETSPARRGLPAQGSFEIALPALPVPTRQNNGSFYGF